MDEIISFTRNRNAPLLKTCSMPESSASNFSDVRSVSPRSSSTSSELMEAGVAISISEAHPIAPIRLSSFGLATTCP